jgi:small subunit ribosomal protein S20
MPHHKQFEKTLRQDAARRLRNRTQRARLRHALRDFHGMTNAKEASAKLAEVSSLLDKGAKTHLIHPAAANRLKSRLALQIGRLQTAKHA